jgi:predicted RNA-binding protein with PUA-like domain
MGAHLARSSDRMSYWLLKSEPGVFSWDDQVKLGAKGGAWTGVRNHQAKLNLMKMAEGDLGFFYHSQDGREIVGVVEVIRTAYPDPTADAGTPWVCVDVKSVSPLKTPVTLEMAKAESDLKGMVLVNNTRLSVQPVSDSEWRRICVLGGAKA